MNARDWNPDSYSRFADLRLRPAVDLIRQMPDLPAGPIIDLGCGTGVVGPVLSSRYPGHSLLGVDSSPAMLDEARATTFYSALTQADIATWTPDIPPAAIFSNAALNWLEDHPRLLPRLAETLAPGGVLAVQMPNQYAAPSHALLRRLAQEMFPDRFSFDGWSAPVASPQDYARLLAPQGHVNAWSTTYVQTLEPSSHTTHPVRAFTEATVMRPFLEQLDADEAARYISRYEVDLAAAYPSEPGGSVLFPFTRVFFVLERTLA